MKSITLRSNPLILQNLQKETLYDTYLSSLISFVLPCICYVNRNKKYIKTFSEEINKLKK